MKVFIPGNMPSSKNSQTWTGKFLVKSKTTQKYEKATKEYYTQYAEAFREAYDKLIPPVTINFLFIRGSKHKFDYINPAQTVQDLMVKHNWIPDDNCDCIIPVFEPYQYDKEKPGTHISLPEN